MTLWRGQNSLILASQSRARKMLLEDIDERVIQQGSGLTEPGEIAALLARDKALFVSSRKPGHYVIGADQTLALGRELFSKPADKSQAFAQLKALAGHRHQLHSAVAMARDGKIMFCHVTVAELTMRAMSEAEIAVYVDAAGEAVTSSVGAYQLEGLGVHLFERISGDHFTILGLPLLPLLAFLRSQSLLAI
jgi:septum formation protein